MDAELATQIGHGLNRLSDSLLEHQRASARDRGMTLQKIDDLDRKFDTKFDALAERLGDVCDRGRNEHRSMQEQIDELTSRLNTAEARWQGRADILKPALTWAGKNWAILLLGFVLTYESYIEPALSALTAPQATASELRGR